MDKRFFPSPRKGEEPLQRPDEGELLNPDTEKARAPEPAPKQARQPDKPAEDEKRYERVDAVRYKSVINDKPKDRKKSVMFEGVDYDDDNDKKPRVKPARIHINY